MVGKIVTKMKQYRIYLPTSESRGIADQYSMDDWSRADDMIDQVEYAHNYDKEKHLKRLEDWMPPENIENLVEIIDAAVAFLKDHPDAKECLPLGLNAVVNAILKEKEKLDKASE